MVQQAQRQEPRPLKMPASYGNRRWRLRVFTNQITVDNELLSTGMLWSSTQLVSEERGFFTAESAVRHFQTRLDAWREVKHFVILVDEYEYEKEGTQRGSETDN